MRKIKDLSQSIEKKKGEIQTLRADADRCRHAAEAGSRSMEQLEQLRARRAEIQAIAFVDKKEPDTDAIDVEILQLEQSAAATLAQARAARLALIMIEGDPIAEQAAEPAKPQAVVRKHPAPHPTVTRLGLQPNGNSHPGLVNRVVDDEAVEATPEPEAEPEKPKSKIAIALRELAELEEQRRVVACAWLVDRREKAIDRYLQAITDLGPIFAEMAAADACRSLLGEHTAAPGKYVAEAFKSLPEFPIPYNRKIELPSAPGMALQPRYITPIDWMRDLEHGAAERIAMIEELKTVGLLESFSPR